MSDNIRNFNDYRKKIINDEQATEEIDIEIQDPLDFLSAEEREEYYRTQHEAMDRERENLSEDSDEFYLDEDFEVEYEEPVREPERPRAESSKRESARERSESRDREPDPSKKERRPEPKKEKKRPEPPKKEKRRPEPKKEKQEFIRKKHRKEVERRDTEDDYDDEENEFLPLLIVRISSIITGIVILVLIGMILKNKVYDKYFVPDPDEETTTETVVGELAGYTKTGDKIVTTADLNLRNTPSTASDDFIVVQVPQGTVLDRVAVSDDGEWAQIQYEGQLLFCVMKYAQVQE